MCLNQFIQKWCKKSLPLLLSLFQIITPLFADPFDQTFGGYANLTNTSGSTGNQVNRSAITQYGITWTFDQDYPTGQFVNGDYYVVGPVRIISITPNTQTVNGRVVNGSMINPNAGSRNNGYDSELFGTYVPNTYQANLNVALGISATNPLVVPNNSSLISAQSQLTPDPGGSLGTLATVAVLTVLPIAPPQGSFRPPYTGADKTIRFNEAQLDFSKLANLNPTVGTPTISSVVDRFQRAWLDHSTGWVTRLMHPVQNMPDYGRDFTTLYGTGALLTNLNFSQTEKRLLVIRLVQIGIDFFGNVSNGGEWGANGGQCSGRKFPILFAGALLNYAPMLDIGQNYPSIYLGPGNPANRQTFGEDGQTYYVRETSPGVYNYGFGGYTSQNANMPEWSFNHHDAPNADNVSWTFSNYRICCTANAWVGQTLAARFMNLQAAWNHPEYFDYQDRYMNFMVTQPPVWRAWDSWHATMWDTYRPTH